MDTPYSNVVIRPPILDETNYGPWKLKMSIYIQSIDSRVWQRVLDSWSPPMRDEKGDGPKPRAQWTADEISSANFLNVKAINAIFTYVDMNIFNLICTCVSSQDAWDKLQNHCEGSTSSLANEASVLGDPISNERLVCKVLQSIPKRFRTKVCAIDESKDISIMGLDKLIRSLRIYEMEMEEVGESNLGDDSIVLITKKFGHYLKVMRQKEEKECRGYGHYAYECVNRLRKGMNVSLSDEDSEEEQEKCEQVDLISFTTLLEGKKNFQINLLDFGSSVATPGRNTVQKYVCFVASNFDNSSNHEKQVAEVSTLEGIQKLYEELYSDWIKKNKLNTTLSKENAELKAVVARLEVLMSKKDLKLGLLNTELEKAKTNLARFNSSSNKLDSLLTMGKDDKFGLGFKESVFEIDESSKSPVFVKEDNTARNWYFDSGSSRHMTCLKDHLTDYIEQECGRVTYGGGAKGRIVGKGTLDVEGFTKLHNVFYVEGLNANLISISTRSADDCFQLGEELACRHSKIDDFSLLHQKRGHVNFKTLKNLSKFEGKDAEDDVEGLLEFTVEEPSVVPDVATSRTPVPLETDHEDNHQSDEEIELIIEKNIPSKIQKIILHHRLLEMFMELGKPELRTKWTTIRWLS
ncbi:uncharacterized protein [Henckelia pumila]|uniref:uncharacterized protein n=1 Tax=Henckelia pumila TaxID=405737 RepID=UPI003C6DC5D4